MPVRIRLSRAGAKKRPFYRIVVADSRRSRDGKFIDRIGTYNPMLAKDSPERIKIDVDKAKEWIQKGAQPSDRVQLFLSNLGVGEKPIITEKTKKHLPRKKTKEKLEAAKEAKKTKTKDTDQETDDSKKTEVEVAETKDTDQETDDSKKTEVEVAETKDTDQETDDSDDKNNKTEKSKNKASLKESISNSLDKNDKKEEEKSS